MTVRRALLCAVCVFAFSVPEQLSAARWCVDGSVSQSSSGATWESAFKTIGEAIDAASDGDTVVVAPGTYVENVHFRGKNIILRSTNPRDPAVVARTIIDGNNAGSAVSFDGSETSACVLCGFTIQNGRAGYGGGICGGTPERQTLAGIHNNVITRNRSEEG